MREDEVDVRMVPFPFLSRSDSMPRSGLRDSWLVDIMPGGAPGEWMGWMARRGLPSRLAVATVSTIQLVPIQSSAMARSVQGILRYPWSRLRIWWCSVFWLAHRFGNGFAYTIRGQSTHGSRSRRNAAGPPDSGWGTWDGLGISPVPSGMPLHSLPGCRRQRAALPEPVSPVICRAQVRFLSASLMLEFRLRGFSASRPIRCSGQLFGMFRRRGRPFIPVGSLLIPRPRPACRRLWSLRAVLGR